MMEGIKDFFGIILGIVVFAVLVYFVWALFIPMTIGNRAVERKVTEQSLQYVQTQRAELVTLYSGYTNTTDEARQTAIKGQMCEIAVTIPSSEIPAYIKGLTSTCH